MSNRVHFIEKFASEIAGANDRYAAYAALVTCLTPEEACEALDPTFEQPYARRRVVVRKLQTDIKSKVDQCHRNLLVVLEEGIRNLRGPKRASAANTLLALAESLPKRQQHSILRRLSQSSNGTVRKQVYRHLKEFPNEVCPTYLLQTWKTFGDLEAARLLLFRAPEELIARHFEDLEAQVREIGYLLSRLYLRLRSNPPATLDRLSRIDPISHAYVCVKLGVSLSTEHMVSVYRQSLINATHTDDRSGLVMWCAGQMTLWDAVLEMQYLAENPPEEVEAARLPRYPWIELRSVAVPASTIDTSEVQKNITNAC